MSLGDIDDFVQKSTILQQTIRGIADGTIDDTIIDLGEFGILTPEQQKAEDERNVRARKELEWKRAMEEKEKREREKAQWWEGAICLYGPIEGEREIAGGATDVHDVDVRRKFNLNSPLYCLSLIFFVFGSKLGKRMNGRNT